MKGSSSASSPTSPAKPGFVYFLKHKGHLQYASTRTEVYAFTRDQVAKYSLQFLGTDPSKRFNITINLSRHVYSLMQTGFDAFQEYDLSSIKVDTLNLANTTTGKTASSPGDTLCEATVVYNDSIPRFWDKPRKWWIFSKTRLRVSLSQDSLNLNARLFYTNYNFTPRSDLKYILNPNYRPKIVGAAMVETTSPAYLISPDSTVLAAYARKNMQQKPLIPSYGVDSVGEQIDTPKYQRLMREYADYYLPQYKKDFYKAMGNSFRNKGDMNASVFEDYEALVRLKTILDSIYVKSQLHRKRIIYHLWKFANTPLADPYSSVYNAAAMIDEWRNLPIDTFKLAPPLPLDIFHKRTAEVAMAINADDSASNFYFTILHKTLLRDPMYYVRFHYATWDYGTVTIPFRYRPAQPKGHILLNKDSATPAPSASDATLNLSAYFGRKWGATRFYEDPTTTSDQISVEPVVFTGPTLIALSATNVDTSSHYMVNMNGYSYTGPSNIIAWSFGGGGVLAFKGLTIGIFGGLDVPLVGKTGWVYRDKPWIGFGIGFNLGVLATGNSN